MDERSAIRSESPVRWDVLGRACAAQLLSVLGEHVFLSTALPLWAYDLTRSPRGVALALGAVMVPALLSLPAGAWTSRHSTRGVLIGCAALRLLATALLLLISTSVSGTRPLLAGVLALTFTISLVDSFFMPAIKAAVPEWVPAGDLVRANSLLEATDIPGYVFGPLIGVFLYERWGLAGAAAAQVAAYAAGLGFIAACRFPPAAAGALPGESGLRARLGYTIHCALRRFVVRRTLLAWTAGMVALGVAEVLSVPFVTQALHQPERVFGIFGALMGLGMAVGGGLSALLEGKVSDRALLAGAALVSTAALAVYAHGQSVAVCGAALLVAGIGVLGVHVAATTLLQVNLPPEARAGMLGLTHSIEAGGLLFGVVLGGDLAARWGIRNTLDGAVVVLMGATALAFATMRQATASADGPDTMAMDAGYETRRADP